MMASRKDEKCSKGHSSPWLPGEEFSFAIEKLLDYFLKPIDKLSVMWYTIYENSREAYSPTHSVYPYPSPHTKPSILKERNLSNANSGKKPLSYVSKDPAYKNPAVVFPGGRRCFVPLGPQANKARVCSCWQTPDHIFRTQLLHPVFASPKTNGYGKVWIPGSTQRSCACRNSLPSPSHTSRIWYVPARIAATPHIKAVIDIKRISGSRQWK